MKKSLAEKVLSREFRNKLDRDVAPHIFLRADGRGNCGLHTARVRKAALLLCFAQLKVLGYRLQEAKNMRTKHVRALVSFWDSTGLSASEIQNRFSFLTTYCEWMGKRDVMGELSDYLPKERYVRTGIAQENRSWKHNGVDFDVVVEKAKELDERMAAMILMQHTFGLRVKESIEFKPAHSLIDGGKAIEVFLGTKGGRLRRIDMATPEQVAAMTFARLVASKHPSGRLRWPDTTWRQAQGRFYRLMRRKLGISRQQCNVTAHGLRHGNLQGGYTRRTGLPTPIEGGALGQIDWETHQAACREVAKDAGHNRSYVTGGYCGSYGHQLRGTHNSAEHPPESGNGDGDAMDINSQPE